MSPATPFDGSSVKIDPMKLEHDLTLLEKKIEEKFKKEKRGIPMEAIPIEILKRCVEACMSQRRGRDASPEEVEIRSISASLDQYKGKDWGISTNLRLVKNVSKIVR